MNDNRYANAPRQAANNEFNEITSTVTLCPDTSLTLAALRSDSLFVSLLYSSGWVNACCRVQTWFLCLCARVFMHGAVRTSDHTHTTTTVRHRTYHSLNRNFLDSQHVDHHMVTGEERILKQFVGQGHPNPSAPSCPHMPVVPSAHDASAWTDGRHQSWC